MTTPPLPRFQEEYSAKLPALALLCTLGWTYLPPREALAARDGKTDAVVLREVLRETLRARRFEHAGSQHPLSEGAVDKLVAGLCSPALNEGLIAANETLYNHLLHGIAVTEYVDGRKTSQTIPIIDWHTPANNRFHVTEEFTVTRAGGVDTRRPDIVCFVNGLPLVVIEAKRPDGHAGKAPTVAEGISQSLRNQRVDEIPRLFAYSQLLLSISGVEGRYATCGTPLKFWASWREEDMTPAEMLALKNAPLPEATVSALFEHRNPRDLDWYRNWVGGGELAVSGQDTLLISLLRPERLLDMTRLFTLFDKKAGKIVARYQQVFGIKRLIERIDTRTPTGGRQGGVVWHTTGSGKSFTMVFLSKAMILHDSLKPCRIVVVTDRLDLEDQLSRTFASGGEIAGKKDKAAAMATSGTRLAEQIGHGTERIIFSLVQKFNTATKLPECRNDSADMVVLVDEGHRTQGGESNIRMRQALPNAAFVAFTGTPLIKDDKTTNTFGPILHAYTMQRAVEDGAVTPLLYEERLPDLDVNERAIDSWFERITAGLTEQQTTDLKRKYARKGEVYSAEDRIRLIAYDIADHVENNLLDGLKGQLACDSKASAIAYKTAFDEIGAFESAIVMTAPDTREGNTAVDDTEMPAITRWWRDHIGSEDEQRYTKRTVRRFEEDDTLKLLIVVDKLLTGFDEPRNAVLYIDKPLKQHNLIQAIARVNRLHPKKEYGLLIDYRGILKELDTTVQTYQDLAARTQGGYDIDDLHGIYHGMQTEYKRLPTLYNQLWACFEGVRNRNDIEQLRGALAPKLQELDGEWVDIHLTRRDDLYSALTAFARCLKVALQSATFFSDSSFSDADRAHYKNTVKQLSALRSVLQHQTGDTVDYGEYAEQVKKLLDKHVVGVEVQALKGVYDVGKVGTDKPEDWSEDKTRNERDTIRTRVTRTIEQDLADDPYAQECFSALLRQVIAEAESLFDYPLKQYMLFREFEEQVEARRLTDIPDAFDGNPHAQAYYGVFKRELPDAFSALDEPSQQRWVALAFDIDTAVDKAVSEHSINPQNIEAEIRKALLPRMYQTCKSVGGGMEQAKRIVETVVHITRVGLNKG